MKDTCRDATIPASNTSMTSELSGANSEDRETEKEAQQSGFIPAQNTTIIAGSPTVGHTAGDRDVNKNNLGDAHKGSSSGSSWEKNQTSVASRNQTTCENVDFH